MYGTKEAQTVHKNFPLLVFSFNIHAKSEIATTSEGRFGEWGNREKVANKPIKKKTNEQKNTYETNREATPF